MAMNSRTDWRLLWPAFILIMLIAFALRVHFFDASWAVGEVQYRSALIARSFYLERGPDVADWRKEINQEALQRMPVKEPPVSEYLDAWLYSLSGGETLWLGRLLRSSFWLVAGALLFQIIRQGASTVAAVSGLAFFLLLPMSVYLSIRLQPDPLMMLLFVAALWSITRYGTHPSPRGLVLASILSALAVLVKPLVIFATGLAFLFVLLQQKRKPGKRLVVHLAVYAALFVLIGCAYYLYGILTGNNLQTGAMNSFRPALLLQPGYWRDWLLTAAGAVGFMPLFLAVLGIPLARESVPRALLGGLWLGYVLFCMVFTHHIRFNAYYHSQLIVIVALSFAPLVTLLFVQMRKSIYRWSGWVPVGIALGLWLLLAVQDLRSHMRQQTPIEAPQTAIEIGELVNHSSRTVLVSSYYGRPLMYMGELAGTFWPRRDAPNTLETGEASVAQRLEALGFRPEYFVITNFREFENHHQDLQQFLDQNCQLKASNRNYLIYHACTL